MSHFAQIDENNIVQQVLVIEQTEIDTGNWGNPNTWIQTSYNTRGGVYYIPNTMEPDPDQSKALHKNYAAVGDTWDGVGFAAPQPHPSWILNNSSYLWEPPVARPQDGKLYTWDEPTISWVTP
jgi:hypothetical protein